MLPAAHAHPDEADCPHGIHRLVIVVPCFNEAARIDTSAFQAFIHDNPTTTVMFVDDGSSDATAEVLKSICVAANDTARIVRLSENQGKAEAVRKGMLECIRSGAAFAGYWDADLATPLSEVTRFMKLLEADKDVFAVIGARVQLLGTKIVRSPFRHYLGRVFATAASLVLGVAVYDTQCGAKLFRLTPAVCNAFAKPFRGRWIFDVELLGRIIHNTQSGSASRPAPSCCEGIIELPVRQWVDVHGSKLRARDFIRAAWDLAVLAIRGVR